MTITRTPNGIVNSDWWCKMPNLTDRIKQTVLDVQSGDTETSPGTSLRDEFESFKQEVYASIDALREDIHNLQQQAQQGK